MAVTPPPKIIVAEPIPIPTLNVLPPSSDTESWSCSPSPRPQRHRSRSRNPERKKRKVKHEQVPENHWDTEKEERESSRSLSRSSTLSLMVSNVEEEEQGSPSVLLPPPHSWSRSSSLSRRSRWSLRSLLNKDSDCDSTRSVCVTALLGQLCNICQNIKMPMKMHTCMKMGEEKAVFRRA